MNTNTLYTKAFEYAVHGYSIMPLRRQDKLPLLSAWKQYQTVAATEEQIEKWWQQYPEANVGIITGKVSGIIVIDIDVYKKGAVSIDKFPETYTVKTGRGGYHLYYIYQAGFTISANAYPHLPGVDIRSDGGYVVAPPSKTTGVYEVIKDVPLVPFPSELFSTKVKRTLSQTVGVKSGSRNDSITSFIGRLLQTAKVSDWNTEVWSAVQTANATYKPPLSDDELLATFASICKKEKARRKSLVVSPYQIDGTTIEIPLRKNSNGMPYKDMANVLAVLETHPQYKDAIKYNTFRQEIEYRGKTLEDGDLVQIQYFMQKEMQLASIAANAIQAAVQHYAMQHQYDEATQWVQSLVWDKKPRLCSWLHITTGCEDTAYHTAVGAQWFRGLVQRITSPGCVFDYVLVLVGAQGIGKTSVFRILGGQWYKNYTGSMDNKDFFLALRGAVIVDLDEGASLYKSEAIKIKSMISNTHDEYREPYGRIMKKYPRRFVFSMSTNDTEPFRDVTGNRRYWPVDVKQRINFAWLEENRHQLYAEAYHYIKNGVPLPEVDIQEAQNTQEAHLPGDAWTPIVFDVLQKNPLYCNGDILYNISIADLFSQMFKEQNLVHLSRGHEMRIATILKKEVGMESRREMIDGERKVLYYLTPARAEELQKNPLLPKVAF